MASSILLVARKREGTSTAEYETTVRPELETVVRERVNTLWEMGISGADLLIASVGAGLRAFTRFARVEYANGEEVPAERFLSEVETVVLETILTRLSKEVVGQAAVGQGAVGQGAVGQGAVGQAARLSAPSQAGGLSHLDPATRFYLLWRYTYRTGELDAGEAIVFANGTHVELDGPGSLSYGARALVAKKKAKYRLLDFTQRGDEERLGLPDRETGQPAPLVDALHRVLWLMEHAPLRLAEYLEQSGVDREQLRLVAQALAGPVLKGGDLTGFAPSAELSALAKLTANWKSVVEEATLTPGEREARRTGQKTFRFDRE
ncbi:hypothetical protein HS125_04135 [bacterium]|nr:hypothetical protein [bacterium]